MRSCGPCSACCGVIAVHALEKPEWKKCPHQAEGCTIYQEQPEPCRKYRCSWLSGDLQEKERPDLVGVIVDQGLSSIFKPIWGEHALCVREIEPESRKSPQATELIDRLVNEDRPVFVKMFGGGVVFRCNDQGFQQKFANITSLFGPGNSTK